MKSAWWSERVGIGWFADVSLRSARHGDDRPLRFEFRLDSFDNSSSSHGETILQTGFVGLTQPVTLGVSLTNNAPLVRLTAATNFHLPRAELDESGGLDASGGVVEHERHGAVY